jgi:hypothetical protein
MLGLCCHFIDRSWQARTVVLGMKRLIGPHSGENMASLLKQVLQTYKIGPRLGYCVLDNAGDNDTCLRVVEEHLRSDGVIWDADAHRLRCFGHIVNLIATAFLENKPTKTSRHQRPPGEPKPVWTRPNDAITKLHTIVVFIMLTGQRIEKFEEVNKSVHDPILHPIKEQITRWFSTLNMLRRAIKIKDSIDLFVARHSNQSPNEKTLFDSIMSPGDWNYTKEVIDFMEPLEDLMLSLEGRETSGMISIALNGSIFTKLLIGQNGYAHQVLPSYDLIKSKMEEQLFGFDVDEVDQTSQAELANNRLQLNIINTMKKLDKYRQLLTSPIYFAAVVLLPWYKWSYFEENMDAADSTAARMKVQKLWDDSYASIEVEVTETAASASQNKKVSSHLLILTMILTNL